MFTRTLRFTALILALTGFALIMPGTAGSARADMKIAVVNVQTIMTDSKAAQSIQKQLAAQHDTFQADITKKQAALQQLGQQIAGQPDSKGLDDKKADYQKKLLEAQQTVSLRQKALEKAAGNALEKLRQEFTQVVVDMAKEQKYDLVLTRQNVILATEALDITPAVLKALDAKVQKIDVKVDTN